MFIIVKHLAYLLREYRLRLLGISALFVLLSIIDLLGVGLIAPFVAVIVKPATASHSVLGFAFPEWMVGRQYGVILAAGIVFAFVLKTISAVFVQWVILGFVTKTRAAQIKALMDGYLSQPYEFFLTRNSSTLIQTILVNSKIFADDLLLPLLRMLAELAVILVLTVLLVAIAPVYFLSLIVCMIVAGLIYVYVISRRTKLAGEHVATSQEELVRGVTQGVGGIKEIRTLGVEPEFSNYVANAGQRLGRHQRVFYTFNVIPKYLMELVAVGYLVSLVGYYLAIGRDPAELLPVIATFAVAGIQLMPAFSQAFHSLNSIAYSHFAIDQIYRDLKDFATKPGLMFATEALPAPAFTEIHLRDLSFAYAGSDNRTAVFGPVSLVIDRGSVTGFIGPSGAGKTTLVNLVLGLLEPTSGSVVVHGGSGAVLDPPAARRLFAYIPQEQFLLDDTIEKNITLDWSGLPADVAMLERALKLSDFQRVVAGLPDGLATPCGERGARFSGGERQRLSIARALYHDRQVLVMDEVTSALDSETERSIVKSFERLRQEGLTLIMIAHRQSTLAICDTIIRMANGQIVEQGSFDELVARRMIAGDAA